MAKQKNPILISILSIFLAFAIIAVPIGVSADVKPIEEVQDKLVGISEEEKTVLGNLFILTQEIEAMEREAEGVTKEINNLQAEIKSLEKEIKEQQKDYDKNLEILRIVLVSYQKRGPASYLETLLNAKDLTSFLRSINIIKDFSRNVGELLDSVEEGREKLLKEKDKLSKNVVLLEGKEKTLQEALSKKKELKEEQEAYLNSFKDQKEYYETQLNNLEKMWKDIKIVFSEVVGEFSRIIKGGKFPEKALNLKFSFPVVKGRVYEESFNDIFKKHSKLPEMIFHFYEDKIRIEVPEKHLILDGKFIIEGKTALKFQVEEGRFYGMPLEPSAIDELFRDGNLLIDIKDLAGDMLILNISLKSIEMKEGYLEFEVKTGF